MESYHDTPWEQGKSPNGEKAHCWWGRGAAGTLVAVVGTECGTATQRAAWGFFQSQPLLPYNPAVALLGIYPTGLKTCVPTNAYIKMCIAAFTVIVKNWEQVRRFQYMNEYINCSFAKQRTIIWQQQQNKLSSHVETWWFLNSCGLVKERSLKMAHAVWFHLNDILEKANYRDRLENKSLVVKGSRSGRVR